MNEELTKADWIDWLDEKIEDLESRFTKPTHGTCCTCQACGLNYDDCVCYDLMFYRKWKQLIEAQAENDEIHAQMIDIVVDLYEQLETKKSEMSEEEIDELMEIREARKAKLRQG